MTGSGLRCLPKRHRFGNDLDKSHRKHEPSPERQDESQGTAITRIQTSGEKNSSACHVRQGGIHTLEVKSVLKKLDDLRFAAKVERDEVRAGAQLLGVELADHIQFVITALRPHGERLGLLGRP